MSSLGNDTTVRPAPDSHMCRAFRTAYSIVLIAVCILITVTLIGVAVICSPFDRRGQTHQRLFRFWARFVLALCRVNVKVVEIAPIALSRNYVVVSNHASVIDPVILIAHLPLPVRFLAKEELFRIPIMGIYMRTTGHIPIKRGSAKSALRSLRDAARVLSGSRMSLLLFPEGTRSGTGLRDFKEGAALLAMNAQLPVLPVGLIDSEHVIPPGSFIIAGGSVRLNIGAPIEPATFPSMDRREDLTELLRTEVSHLCGLTVDSQKGATRS